MPTLSSSSRRRWLSVSGGRVRLAAELMQGMPVGTQPNKGKTWGRLLTGCST